MSELDDFIVTMKEAIRKGHFETKTPCCYCGKMRDECLCLNEIH